MTAKQTLKSKSHSTRLYYLDWLRVIAILFVFFIHVAKIFDFHTSIMFDASKSLLFSVFRDLVLVWVMPLFFIISGAAIFLSKKTDSPKTLIASKFNRLIIPLLFVGTFVINAVYVYIERLSGGQTILDFFNWYPQYFKGIYGFGGNFAPLGNGTYLWYLQFLFIFTLILLPLFKQPKNLKSNSLFKISKLLENPISLTLLFIPISLSSIAFEFIGLGGIRVMGGWDLLSYLFFFIYGYILFCNPKIKTTIYKYAPTIFLITAILSIIYIDSHFGINLNIPGITRHNLAENGVLYPLNKNGWMLVLAFKGLLSWLWILSILGLGNRFLNFPNKFLKYTNEAVLPFYILHHAVIYAVGYQIIKFDFNSGFKFALIATISLIIIMTIYELLIKKINVIRFLFGLKKITKN